jgi:hypothetical protein
MEHGLAEWADVLGPQAGADDDEPAIVEPGDGGPAEVAEPLARQPADHPLLGLERAGRGLRGPGIVGHDHGDRDDDRGDGRSVGSA